MKRELDELLCKKYPKFFRNRHADMRSTAMCWGFDVEDGWFEIIDRLCADIDKHLTSIDYGVHYPKATQVKEKFGTLRFYIDAGDDYTWSRIDQAEAESAKTCEICGKPGELRDTGWLQTLCEEHYKEKLK